MHDDMAFRNMSPATQKCSTNALLVLRDTIAQARQVRANDSLQGINFCRSASATAWVLLRTPSLVCAFFR